MKKILSAVVTLLIAGNTAYAGKVSRPCVQKDMVGSWVMYDMVPVTETLNPLTRYQAYRFNTDGTFLHASNNNPLTPQLLNMIFANKTTGETYEVDDKGLVVMRFPNVAQPDTALCSIMTKASESSFRDNKRAPIKHQRGDLALVYYNGAAMQRFALFLRKHKGQDVSPKKRKKGIGDVAQ